VRHERIHCAAWTDLCVRHDRFTQPLIVPWLVIAAISILALFVSGAFLSIGNWNYEVLKTVHNIAPVVAVVTILIVIFLIEGVL
jgi:hypothetical protein